MTRFATTIAFLVLIAPTLGAQASIAAARHNLAAPADLAPAIAQKLASESVRVTIGGSTILDFWWVTALPVKPGASAPSWAQVEEGTLVGAVHISSDFRDIRGRILKSGLYTLRYGLQPQNGDHLGVSPYREFLLLSPAGVDKDHAPLGHDGTIEVSKQSIGGSHPGVWSLDPPFTAEAPLSVQKTELEHDTVIMEVPITRDGKPSGTLRFGVVLIGKIEA